MTSPRSNEQRRWLLQGACAAAVAVVATLAAIPSPEPAVLFALVLTVSMAAVVIAASRGLGQAAAPLRVIGLAVIVTLVAMQALSDPGASRLGSEGVIVALWTVLATSAFACALLARSVLGGEPESWVGGR